MNCEDIVRILSRQMLVPFIPQCAKKATGVCLVPLNGIVAMEKGFLRQRGKVDRIIQESVGDRDLTDSTIWVWK